MKLKIELTQIRMQYYVKIVRAYFLMEKMLIIRIKHEQGKFFKINIQQQQQL